MGSWPSKRGTSSFMWGHEGEGGVGVWRVLREEGVTVRAASRPMMESSLASMVVWAWARVAWFCARHVMASLRDQWWPSGYYCQAWCEGCRRQVRPIDKITTYAKLLMKLWKKNTLLILLLLMVFIVFTDERKLSIIGQQRIFLRITEWGMKYNYVI